MGSSNSSIDRFFQDGVCTLKNTKSGDTTNRIRPGMITATLLNTSWNHWHRYFLKNRPTTRPKFNLHDRSIFFRNVCSEWAGGQTGRPAGWADVARPVGISGWVTRHCHHWLSLPTLFPFPLAQNDSEKRREKLGREAKHLGPDYVTPFDSHSRPSTHAYIHAIITSRFLFSLGLPY